MRTACIAVLCSAGLLPACQDDERPPAPPIPARCAALPFAIATPVIEGPTLYFGAQGGNHIFGQAQVTGLDEGGRLALVMADPDTSEVLGSVNLDANRLIEVDGDPCVRDVPAIELRFDTNIAPFRVVTLRAVATRSTGEVTSAETTACLIPMGGDPADCGATLTLMRLSQDGRALSRDAVLYLEDPDLDSGTWMAEVEVAVDPIADGRVSITAGGTMFDGALAGGDALVTVEIRSNRYAERLRVTATDDAGMELASQEYPVRPIPQCPLDELEHPCREYWDTILVDGEGSTVDGFFPSVEALEGAELWIDSRAFVEGDVRVGLACDGAEAIASSVLPNETTLDYLGIPLELPSEAGEHRCVITVVQVDPVALRVLTETSADYVIE